MAPKSNPTPHEEPPAKPPLAGRTLLVTGGARRVGAALARKLHGAGANVVLHFRRSTDEAAQLVRELEAVRAGSTAFVQTDLLDLGALPGVIDAAVRAFGQLDILVNNASTFYPTEMGEITAAHWDDLLGTNLRAPLFLAQAAAPALRITHGLILNIADIHGMRPLKRYPVYSVAKAGLIMLTKALAREMAPHVRVNAIAPGPVMWPEDGTDQEMQARILDKTLLRRAGSADDVARAALFFATEAPYLTGQILAVDGGRSVGW